MGYPSNRFCHEYHSMGLTGAKRTMNIIQKDLSNIVKAIHFNCLPALSFEVGLLAPAHLCHVIVHFYACASCHAALLRTRVILRPGSQQGGSSRGAAPGILCGHEWRAVQFCSLRPGTRLNSRSLLVTRVSPADFACAAIQRSLPPIILPRASSAARISP